MNAARVEPAAALILAATLVVLGAAVGAAKKSDDPRMSTYVDSREGLHALHLVLEGVGAEPRRMTHAPSATDPTDRTLVVANPSVPVTKREAARIVEWVEAGGRLVIVGGPPPVGTVGSSVRPLYDAFHLREIATTPGAIDSLRVVDPALADGIGLLDWPATRAIAADDGLVEMVDRGSRCLVGRRAWGVAGGEVVVIADDKLVANASLGRHDDAVLAVRILLGRASDEGRVVFDEFHHGFEDGGGAGHVGAAMLDMLVGTWPGRALLVLALAGVVALIGASVRLGAPERERPPPRRALSEHAEALGRLFETTRARSAALRILAAGARRATAARAGIPAAAAPAEFVRRLRASPAVGAQELADAIARADAASASKDVEMAAAAANLAAAKRSFIHGRE